MDVRIHQSDLKFWRRWYDIKKHRIIPSIVHNRKQGRVGENECSDITQTPQVLLVVCKSTHKEIQEMLGEFLFECLRQSLRAYLIKIDYWLK